MEITQTIFKQYLRNIHKSHDLDQLRDGIQQFLETLIPEACARDISHLNKVIPKAMVVPSEY